MSIDLVQYHGLYIKTSRDLIETMNKSLQTLHTDIQDQQAITRFHIAAHSLKSQSLVMGYQQLGTVNRQLETFFRLIQEHEITLNKKYLDMLTNIVSHLEHAIADIEASENEPDLAADIEALNKHIPITS